ncbi:FkbM family methyltransferase [Trichocoleus desertorum AS-A10]|uniref:FkbM family methyltransferase n=1 Tax=Trichocoleus desertorum TaxID=1481672 RepID=UPI0032973B5E
MSTPLKTISLLCPTRGRPDKALRLVLSVLKTAHHPERVEVLFYVDTDDSTKLDYVEQLKAHKTELNRLKQCFLMVNEPIGVSKAWNALATASQGDLLVMAADDQIYNDAGWDTRLDQETAKFPDEIFCMWFNEGHWGEKLCTFPIVSRKWCLTLGYFITGIFECLYDDLWIMDIAKRVGRLHYIPDVLTEHLHWGYGKAEIDSTYEFKQVDSQGNLKPAVRRDMDLFGRTAPYREADARRIAAVMHGPVTLQPGLSPIGRPTIFNDAKGAIAPISQPAVSPTKTQVVNLTITSNQETKQLKLYLDAEKYTQQLMLSRFSAGKLYETEVSDFLIQTLRPGDRFIDIGAHVGYFSLLAATLVGGSGSVLAFEMESANYKKILENIELNQLSNLKVFNVALGAETKEAQFFVNLDNDGGHALWNVGAHQFNQKSRMSQATKKVSATTLDQALTDQNSIPPKMIKIDTEGAELQVLKGSINILKSHRVPYIISEVNRFGLQQMGTNETELREWMRSLGYDAYLMQASSPNLVKLEPNQYCDTTKVFNLLFSRV